MKLGRRDEGLFTIGISTVVGEADGNFESISDVGTTFKGRD